MNFEIGQRVIMFKKHSKTITEEKHVIDNIINGIVSLEDTLREFDLDGKCVNIETTFGFIFWIESERGNRK